MDKPTFPDIDGLLGSIRHVATPVGQQTVSDEPDGTTTIDECDIDRKCRSDVINAIVRTFITVYLPRLRAYRKKSKSLLDNDNTK